MNVPEHLPHLVVQAVGAVEDDALLGQGLGQIFGRLRLAGSGGASRRSSQVQLQRSHQTQVATILTDKVISQTQVATILTDMVSSQRQVATILTDKSITQVATILTDKSITQVTTILTDKSITHR